MTGASWPSCGSRISWLRIDGHLWLYRPTASRGASEDAATASGSSPQTSICAASGYCAMMLGQNRVVIVKRALEKRALRPLQSDRSRCGAL